MKAMRALALGLLVMGAVLLGGAPTDAFPGTTARVSVDGGGNQGNDDSMAPAISADGRYVAFHSSASNLVPGDTNTDGDIFVHDRQTGVTERVSVDSAGNQGNDWSDMAAISADGRFVAFESWSTNLVPGDTNHNPDVFVHDRLRGVTERASVDSEGNQVWGSRNPAISADGRYVAFDSNASNLVAGDTNEKVDVFVHDRQTGATERVSLDSGGNQANGNSRYATIGADGRYVAFQSEATDLVPNDSWCVDVFIRDRQSGTTTRVSVDSLGNQGNGDSYGPIISANGRYVAFHSYASNLVPGDTNDVCDTDFDHVYDDNCPDVFVHDRYTGATERVSVDSNGDQGNEGSDTTTISGSGRYVAFSSYASNLVPGDINGYGDVFVHDRQTGVTERVSADSAGNQGNGGVPWNSAISADGRFVAFASGASNLVPGDTNGRDDVFVRDRGPACDTGLDADGDEFDGELECYVGTDPWDACPDGPTDDAWPPDIQGAQGYGFHNGRVDIMDVLCYKPKLRASYDPRYDLNADGAVDILDVLLYKPVFGAQCTNP